MTKIEKENFIFSEYQRLSDIFKELPEDKFSVVYPLIKSACFMRATLEDLAEIINEQGTVEIYRNSETQYGTKMSAALQSYTNTGRLYANVIKQLYGLLPERSRPTSTPYIKPEQTEEEKEAYRRELEEYNEQLREKLRRDRELDELKQLAKG